MTNDDQELEEIKKRMAERLVAEAQSERARSEAPAAPVTVTDADFDDFVARHETVVIDFWAPWCGPCRVIGPILDEVAQQMQGRLVVGKLNVDENPRVPRTHQVQGIPTLIVFHQGKPVDRIVGALPKPHLVAKLSAHVAR